MLVNDSITHWDIKPDQIIVSESSIIRLLGMSNAVVDEYTLSTINKYITQSVEYFHPQAVSCFQKVDNLDKSNGKIRLNSQEFLVGKIIASQLQEAEFIALFACTIGHKVEKHVDELFGKSDMLEAYIFSLIGSEAAESIAAIVHENIKEEAAAKKMNITNRFSPGYCRWNVAEQHLLFSYFPKGAIDITLTDSALMTPIKSVSGIIGVGKNVQHKPYQCKACSESHCIYRDKNSY